MLESLRGGRSATANLSPEGEKGIGKSDSATNLNRDGTFVVPRGGRSRFSGLVRVQCPWCPAVLSGQEMAREHERGAHRQEACQCSDCGKGFSCGEDLRRHSRATGHAIHVRFRLINARTPSVTSSSYATSTEARLEGDDGPQERRVGAAGDIPPVHWLSELGGSWGEARDEWSIVDAHSAGSQPSQQSELPDVSALDMFSISGSAVFISAGKPGHVAKDCRSTASSKGKGNGGGATSGKGNCHNCGKTGHYATDCRGPGGAKESKIGGSGKGGGKNFDCFNCGRSGHMAKDCWTKGGKGRGKGKKQCFFLRRRR